MIFKHIEEKAESLLKEGGFYEVGFDIDALVRYLNIDLVKKSFDGDISGLLATNGDKVVISYNSSEDSKRQRFTIAHELGHFTLHSKSQPIFIDKVPRVMYRNNASASGEILKEREANAFAAALLMPHGLLINEINNCPLDSRDVVGYLAKQFKVSEQAMSFRLSNLGYYIG